MKGKLYILFVILGLCACSTQKNTGASRSFHEMKTYHNIYFNGRISMVEGLKAIDKANEDDYTRVLNLYPVSNHKAAEASVSSMDQAIEKCRKCIKLHSIHVKPKKIDPKRRSDPAYQNWLQSKEFNKQMYHAWLMLGQAEFHKGDFLGSIGTFNYVQRLYDNDNDVKAQCSLWIARAYAEMGWQYEAEDILERVNVDHLKRKNQAQFAAASADVLLKGGHLKEAIPFVKIARQNEQKKLYRPRFEFVLGQLYQLDHQSGPAKAAYKRVLKMHPENEMDFNTRLRIAELDGDTLKTMKQLRRMAKLYKYRDQLDQIYGTMGNIYLYNRDTISALRCYEDAIAGSTKNGINKAAVLLTAGDIYYERKDFVNALPCYQEAVQIITTEHPEYARVKKRSEVLDELVVEVKTVQLQDSLQYLSSLSEEEQRAIVDKIIEDLIEKEKNDSLKAMQDARDAELAERSGPRSVNTQGMLGGSTGDNSWYFYNEQLLRKGKQTFTQKWGTRPLEDNWRRRTKTTTSSFMDENGSGTGDMDENEGDTNINTGDSIGSLPNDSVGAMPKPSGSSDPHDPNFYLQQIPRTDADFESSNRQIASALWNMIDIYRDKMQEIELSNAAFDEYCRRFSKDSTLVDLYYNQYLSALRMNDTTAAEQYRADIMRLFPETTQAKIVSNPNYFESLRRMAMEQDSLYEATYNAYVAGQFEQVKQQKVYAEENYPLSPLMPRFLFLNAVAVARTEGQEPFINQLRDMVNRYPSSELGAMAKDMLAMMGQGMESQTGGSLASLQDLRKEDANTEMVDSTLTFSDDKTGTTLVYLLIPQDEAQLNNLLYEVALFNFSQFLIKDFDLVKYDQSPFSNPMAGKESALEISVFDGIDEGLWYIGLLQENAVLSELIQRLNAKVFAITETNKQLLEKGLSLEKYLTTLDPRQE